MNKYLEKLAALNPTAKAFATGIANKLKGNAASINSVYGKTTAAVSKSPAMKGVLSDAEKMKVRTNVGAAADGAVGKGKLTPFDATRAARAGARLARMKSTT
jgi:hypothetical protein